MATSGSSEPVVLLQRNFQHLVNSLNMDALLPAALGYGVITDRQRAECASKGDSSYAKADTFLGHLVRIVTGDTSKFYTFLKVLDDTGQSAIASRLRGESSSGDPCKSSATTESTKDKNKRANDVFTKHYDKLVQAIDKPLVLAAKLKTEGYISKALMRDIESAKGVPDDDKSIKLLNAVEALLGVHDDAYGELETLMSILEEEGGRALKAVIKSMRRMLKEGGSS